MLSTLKDKFLNVTKTMPLFNNSEQKEQACELNLNAGYDVLGHFQKNWGDVHVLNEENAKKADEAANDIVVLLEKVSEDKKSLGLMTHILCNSNLTTNISNCSKHVEQLYEMFNTVENELLKLECLIDTIEFENMKKQHRLHLEMYRNKKRDSIMVFEENLKEKHEKAISDLEQKKQKELEERQKVFHEAFKSDIEIYKNFGTLPKLEIAKKPSALLEEIQVDYDEQELDQFFESSH